MNKSSLISFITLMPMLSLVSGDLNGIYYTGENVQGSGGGGSSSSGDNEVVRRIIWNTFMNKYMITGPDQVDVTEVGAFGQFNNLEDLFYTFDLPRTKEGKPTKIKYIARFQSFKHGRNMLWWCKREETWIRRKNIPTVPFVEHETLAGVWCAIKSDGFLTKRSIECDKHGALIFNLRRPRYGYFNFEKRKVCIMLGKQNRTAIVKKDRIEWMSTDGLNVTETWISEKSYLNSKNLIGKWKLPDEFVVEISMNSQMNIEIISNGEFWGEGVFDSSSIIRLWLTNPEAPEHEQEYTARLVGKTLQLLNNHGDFVHNWQKTAAMSYQGLCAAYKMIKDKPSICLEDIPEESDIDVIALREEMKDVKEINIFRKLQFMWHPDKFTRKYESKIKLVDVNLQRKIKDAVSTLCKFITEIRDNKDVPAAPSPIR